MSTYTRQEIEAKANDLIREAYGSDRVIPPVDLERIAKYLNLNLEFGNFSEGDIDGQFIRKQNLIRINENASYRRQSFTVAHEIGHFILHKEKENEVFHRRDMLSGNDNMPETEANKFAAALLMPKSLVEIFFNKIPSEEFIADTFQVSEQAAYFRLKNLGLLR
ncbi:TPA: ImmA/IrrE family metallo-endopeptidase [Legionella pneumophila]|nr:ImmA/IrrE family metallo-endopeptidase [Legionella pneumophila]HDO9820962.1 ImmA/IrrE family metallo-endopeptidase [Legionella pneumophila]